MLAVARAAVLTFCGPHLPLLVCKIVNTGLHDDITILVHSAFF